jgi:hypothetical protein
MPWKYPQSREAWRRAAAGGQIASPADSGITRATGPSVRSWNQRTTRRSFLRVQEQAVFREFWRGGLRPDATRWSGTWTPRIAAVGGGRWTERCSASPRTGAPNVLHLRTLLPHGFAHPRIRRSEGQRPDCEPEPICRYFSSLPHSWSAALLLPSRDRNRVAWPVPTERPKGCGADSNVVIMFTTNVLRRPHRESFRRSSAWRSVAVHNLERPNVKFEHRADAPLRCAGESAFFHPDPGRWNPK